MVNLYLFAVILVSLVKILVSGAPHPITALMGVKFGVEEFSTPVVTLIGATCGAKYLKSHP